MTPPSGEAATLDFQALDRLMPMHLVVSATGHIRHAGPTLQKVVPAALAGRRLLEAFEVRRPRDVRSAAEIVGQDGGCVQLALREGKRLLLKGQAIGASDGGLIVNLSFGISVIDAIGAFALTGADFAPTDLSVEMLYLAEAREAVMREAMKLNRDLDEARREAERLAKIDALTGLANRRALGEALAGLIRRRRGFALMHVDLDHFKDVNDTLGHAAGDRVLVEVARTLQATTRAGDCVARIGGDEFVIVLPGLTDEAALRHIAWQIITELRRPIPFLRRCCEVSASIGFTTSDRYRKPDAEKMLSDADQALYASKHAGRGTVTLFGDASGHEAQVGRV